jgi:hypothetical protein
MESITTRSEILDLETWRALTKREIGEFLDKLAARVTETREGREKGRRIRRSKGRGAGLIIRTHLTQLDLFCYLKARFGEPNGFQNFLRKDDSDNYIHWEYQIRAGTVDIDFMGSDRQIHI